jgi:hypothetical protein
MRTAWILVFLFGCGGGFDGYDESSGSTDDMAFFAPYASAAAAYANGIEPIYVAGLSGQDTMCPSAVTDGDTSTYTGDCTDDNGNVWVGSAIATMGSTDVPARVEYHGFGYSGAVDGCAGKTGNVQWDGTFDAPGDASHIDFTVDLTFEVHSFDADHGCAAQDQSLGFSYDGTMDLTSPGGNDINTFAGSGKVGASGHGFATTSTDGEVVDTGTCGNEAMSGTTTITAGGHEAVITYDGATDCSTDHTVTWTYDGADQGELTGVSCSAGGGSSGALLILGALLFIRRRGTARRRSR